MKCMHEVEMQKQIKLMRQQTKRDKSQDKNWAERDLDLTFSCCRTVPMSSFLRNDIQSTSLESSVREKLKMESMALEMN